MEHTAGPPRLFVIFNHNLTAAQEQDIRANLGVREIIFPAAELQALWSQVPPGSETLRDYLAPLEQWLAMAAVPGDLVLVQGEFGAVFLLVRYCLDQGLVPVYSTTSREAAENHLPDGRVAMRHVFSHVRFRRYGA